MCRVIHHFGKIHTIYICDIFSQYRKCKGYFCNIGRFLICPCLHCFHYRIIITSVLCIAECFPMAKKCKYRPLILRTFQSIFCLSFYPCCRTVCTCFGKSEIICICLVSLCYGNCQFDRDRIIGLIHRCSGSNYCSLGNSCDFVLRAEEIIVCIRGSIYPLPGTAFCLCDRCNAFFVKCPVDGRFCNFISLIR